MISIIICTYNRSEFVRDALEALQKQVLPDGEPVEILVVDNNSGDGTKDVVAHFSEKSVIPLRYVFEKNQGISFARNRAILEARGDILVFTDDDVVPSAEWIKNIWLAFKQFNPDIVGGPIRPLWEYDPPGWLLNPEFQAHLALLDKGSKAFMQEGGGECNFLYGANMAFKRNVFEKLGTFRTDLGNKGSRLILREDSEMLSRALKAGMKAVYAPSVSVHHKISSQKMGLRYLRRWRFAHGRSQVILSGGTEKFPRWLIRECLGNAFGVIWNYLRRDTVNALIHEKLFWFQAGMLMQSIQALGGGKKDMNIFRYFLNFEKWRRLYLSARYGFIVPRYDGMMDERKCKFLYDIVMDYRGNKTLIVEIGSYMGCSTTWLAVAGMRSGFQSLIAIDLFTGTPSWNQKFDTFKMFMLRIKNNRLETFVKPVRGNSAEVIKEWEAKNKIAILHIDGDHAYEGVKSDIDNYVPYLEQNGIVIFDDYDSEHPDVRRAVHELLNTGDFQILNIVEEIRKGYGSIALQKTSAISYATKDTQAAPESASIKGVLK